MGREWYNYLSSAKSIRRGGGGGGGEGGNGGGGGRDSVGGSSPVAAEAGCMSTLIHHLFDLPHFHFCLHQQRHTFHSSPLPLPLLSDDHPISLKGVQAPRNSLESEEMFMSTASLASVTEEIGEQTFDSRSIPMGINTRSRRDAKLRIQVPWSNSESSRMARGGGGGGGDELSSSESCSSSPGPRTPNLVARLMGLEVLPDGNSTSNNVTPRSSSSSSSLLLMQQHFRHCRQQPRPSSSSSRTPSPSPAARSTSSTTAAAAAGVDGHRLSLQIPKENRLVIAEFELPRHSCSAITTKRRDQWTTSRDGIIFDESSSSSSKSPGDQYSSRHILKHAKENVVMGRRKSKFGVDITNRNEKIDEHLMSFKPEKVTTVTESNHPSENSTPSPSSTRLQGRETSSTVTGTGTANGKQQYPINHRQLKAPSPVPPPSLGREKRPPKSYNGSGRSRASRPSQIHPNKVTNKDELFVRRSSSSSAAAAPHRRANYKMGKEILKRRPLLSTNDEIPATLSTFLLPLKKLEYSSSPVPTSSHVPQQQEQKPLPLLLEVVAPAAAAAAAMAPVAAARTTQLSSYPIPSTGTSRDTSPDFKYITRILNHIGIHRNDDSISLTKWFSPTHPLNPSIFHDLEAIYFSSKGGNCTDGSTDHHHHHHHHHHHLRLRCNRRLVFDLVDQILVETLKHYHPKPKSQGGIGKLASCQRVVYGNQLAELVWKRVLCLPPLANCHAIQDIDSLIIEKDMTCWPNRGHDDTFEEEVGELIALKIEHDMIDLLVQDLVIDHHPSLNWHAAASSSSSSQYQYQYHPLATLR
ncbi:hypothetical protein Dimus_000358 [Dionaea muscipula]